MKRTETGKGKGQGEQDRPRHGFGLTSEDNTAARHKQFAAMGRKGRGNAAEAPPASAAHPLAAAPPAAPDQPAQEEVPKPLAQLLLRARFCERCQDTKHDGPGHRSRSGHPYRALTPEERDKLAKEWRACPDPSTRKQQVRERLQTQRAAWAKASPASDAARVYRLDFGKHKRKTIAEVMSSDAGYLPWCIKSKMHEARECFMRAVLEAGLLDAEALDEAEKQVVEGARLTLARKASEDRASLHPEVQKLRTLQEAEASQVLAIVPDESSSRPLAKALRKKFRKHTSRAAQQVHSCMHCGSSHHNAATCPKAVSKAVEKEGVSAALVRNKRKAVLVAKLKYRSIHQRPSAYERRPVKRSRAPAERPFRQLARMTACELTEALIEDGLLQDLEGTPCPHQACASASDGDEGPGFH